MTGLDGATARTQRHRPLNLVFQLPDVARPPVLRKGVQHLRAQLDIRLPQTIAGLAEEEGAEVRNFLPALAQRRHENANHAEAIVKVLPELAFGDLLFQIGIGRGQYPHVNPLGTRLTDRHDLRLLEKPQQLRLYVNRQIADLIEEQRAASGCSHEARLIRNRAGERTAAMPEELAVGEIPPGRRAVVRQEHRRASMRSDMDG